MQVNCNADSYDNGVAGAVIYAPDSFGNLTINTISGNKCFSGVNIHAPFQSGFIKMKCNSTTTDDNWCVIVLCNNIANE